MTTKKDGGEPRLALEEFKGVCRKYLYLTDDSYIDVVFGAVFANQLDSKPLWIYLVGVPGSGKTEILQAMDGHRLIHSLSNLTPKTLVSGKENDDGSDPSLLPKLDGKILVIKDFTTILSGKADDRAMIFGQLRDAYDGKVDAAFGTGKRCCYESKFGIIAAVTPEIDRHTVGLSALGERFLMFRLPTLTDDEHKKMALRAIENESTRDQEGALKNAAHLVLSLKVSPPIISQEHRRRIVEIAQLAAIGRTGVHRDRNGRDISAVPTSEVPTRLAKQLTDLARGIAMARERMTVGDDEIRLVGRVALDSIAPIRLSVLGELAASQPEWKVIKELEVVLRISPSTIQRHLDDLYSLGLVEKKKPNDVLKGYRWRVSVKYSEFLADSLGASEMSQSDGSVNVA